MNYFVLGLPRSRTAWLSAFLSQSGQFCHHDGLNGCESMQAYQEKIAGCGDSTTGFAFFDIEAFYPDSPRLIIEKSKQELEHCIEWSNSTYQSDLSEYIHAQNDILMSIKAERIQQGDINNRLPFIFEMLTGETYQEKYGKMVDLNIQSDPFAIDLQAARKFLNVAV